MTRHMSIPDMGDVPFVRLSSATRSRHLFSLVTGLTIVAMVFGTLLTLPQVASAEGATTTSSVNLRTGPSTDDAVILVMPEGASLEINGSAENDFYPVTYDGMDGYASVNWVSTGGGGSDGGGPVESGLTGSRVVIDGALNLRNGPSTSDGVIAVMPDGAQVELTGEISNGFTGVTFRGSVGWAFAQYLGSGGGSDDTGDDGGSDGVGVGDSVTGSATVIDGALNLRTGPGTNYDVVLVLPGGASVELMGSPQGGFYPVRYNGTKGWSSGDYLQIGGSAAPDQEEDSGSGSVPVGDSVTGNLVTTAALNMRSGPTVDYGVVTVLPPGTKVDVMGSAQGGFYPVRWAGETGWSSGDWLAEVGSSPAPQPDQEQDAGASGITQIIYDAADRWGQPRADMLRVAQCESNLDPRAVNSSSGASGLFQFMPSTFAFTPNGKAGDDIFDAYASADATGWMWANGMRNHWACQ